MNITEIVNPWKSSMQTLKPSRNIILTRNQIQLSFKVSHLPRVVTELSVSIIVRIC